MGCCSLFEFLLPSWQSYFCLTPWCFVPQHCFILPLTILSPWLLCFPRPCCRQVLRRERAPEGRHNRRFLPCFVQAHAAQGRGDLPAERHCASMWCVEVLVSSADAGLHVNLRGFCSYMKYLLSCTYSVVYVCKALSPSLCQLAGCGFGFGIAISKVHGSSSLE